MTNRTHVHCTINGDEVDFLTTDGESLLNALRDEVGLTGAKEGCGTGDCGACSIMLDGVLTCSCLVFAPEAEGATIVTVEGLAQGDHLSPLQNAFLEG
ncbi:MAG: 2Fe-2S iron-sulfur cluster binding domain-containing protein, partial [Acidimicrobiales bacterium]|nr:2Fe-2S iron-sulfur cluster binding domain-containing protein [Acidimicrobiales bacterium]